jgi:hypothetical protein
MGGERSMEVIKRLKGYIWLFGKLLKYNSSLRGDGFIVRKLTNSRCEVSFPSMIQIGNLTIESSYDVRIYTDGVAIAKHRSLGEEYFLALSSLEKSGEKMRPFQILYDNRIIKFSFGGMADRRINELITFEK